MPYQLVHASRCGLYSLGILKQKQLDAFVISIGNLSFGGSGKTPVTIDIAKYLAKETDKKIAILTRAYKSDASLATPFVLNKDNLDRFTAGIVGDEPMMMAEMFKEAGLDIPIIIDSDRHRAGTYAIEKLGSQVFILDDGLQHIQLARDLEIIVKNINESGFYRELALAENKADFLIHSKVSEPWLRENQDEASVRFDLTLAKDIDKDRGIIAFAGIADTRGFFDALYSHLKDLELKLGLSLIKGFQSISYPDHHQYSLDEVNHLVGSGMNLVCTRKDYVKLPSQYKEQVIPVDLHLSWNPLSTLEEIKGKVLYGNDATSIHTECS